MAIIVRGLTVNISFSLFLYSIVLYMPILLPKRQAFTLSPSYPPLQKRCVWMYHYKESAAPGENKGAFKISGRIL